MNLKSYAVLRKLTANSEFLNYVVQDKPIPVNMLETELHDLLKDIKVDDVDLLINNYQKYLRDNVKLGFQQKENNQFDVNGEIEDPVIETIEILHNVKPNDVVTNLVTSVMSELSPDRDIKIDSVELLESTKKFVQMTEQPFSFLINENQEDTKSKSEESTISNGQEEETDQNEHVQTNDSNIEDEKQTDVLDNDANEQLDDINVDESLDNDANEQLDDINVDDVLDNAESIPTDEIPETAPASQEHVKEPEYDFAKESLPDTHITLSEPVFEEPDEQELQKDAKSTIEAFKEAYDYLVSQIKEKNLDKRLPGLHLAN